MLSRDGNREQHVKFPFRCLKSLDEVSTVHLQAPRIVTIAVSALLLGCGKPASKSLEVPATATWEAIDSTSQPLGRYQSLKLLEVRERVKGSLRGVSAVDARVWVGYDQRLLVDGGMQEVQIKERIEGKFLLELRKLGIKIDERAPNVLTCNLALNYSGRALAFSKAVRFKEFIVVPRTKETREVTIFEWPPNVARNFTGQPTSDGNKNSAHAAICVKWPAQRYKKSPKNPFLLENT